MVCRYVAVVERLMIQAGRFGGYAASFLLDPPIGGIPLFLECLIISRFCVLCLFVCGGFCLPPISG